MAHEIMEHDNVVLHKEKAWHGLGVIVEDAPTPTEALTIAGMDWEVEQWSLVAMKNGMKASIDQVANVRLDTQDALGIVSRGYHLVQNKALTELCEALAEQGDVVKVESAGSIRNGRKVWFLLKGESFSVRDKDEVRPYICVSNGFDGLTTVRGTFTNIRVVCSNTLHMVIPDLIQDESRRRLEEDGFNFRHVGDVRGRLEEAKKALKLYGRSLDANKAMIDRLAAKDVSRESIQRFFLECYTRDFGPIPEVPTNKWESNNRARAMDGFNRFAVRFDRDRDAAGASAWNALNAYTGFIQHDKLPRTKDPIKAEEQKVGSKLFGTDARRGLMSLQLALSM